MASAAAAGAAVVAGAIGEELGEAGGGGGGMGLWGIAAAAEVHIGSAIVGMMGCSVLAERPEDHDILVLPFLLPPLSR